MGKKRRLLTLQAREEGKSRLGALEPDPRRGGGDQQAQHALDAGDQRLAAGADMAVDDVALVGEAGEQDGPGALQKGGESKTVLAGEGLKPGGELGGEVFFILGLHDGSR